MGIKRFSIQEQEDIKLAIQKAEHRTSGEIRVFVEDTCKGDVLDRAAFQFKRLDMHKTALRNGVLIYLSTEDHQFAIIGDAGVHTKTGTDFWDSTKDEMLTHFKKGDLCQGLITGIRLAGEKLKQHFPYTENDRNELPDEIAF